MRQHAQLMMISDNPDVEAAGEQLSELMLNTSPSTADRRYRIVKDTIANELPTTIAKKLVIRQLPRPRTAVLSRKKKKRSTSSKKKKHKSSKKKNNNKKRKSSKKKKKSSKSSDALSSSSSSYYSSSSSSSFSSSSSAAAAATTTTTVEAVATAEFDS